MQSLQDPIGIADRVRALRLERGWTRAELAARAGVALDTLARFERTGHVALARLARLAVALGRGHELDQLFAASPPLSLSDLERRSRPRQRGRRAAS